MRPDACKSKGRCSYGTKLSSRQPCWFLEDVYNPAVNISSLVKRFRRSCLNVQNLPFSKQQMASHTPEQPHQFVGLHANTHNDNEGSDTAEKLVISYRFRGERIEVTTEDWFAFLSSLCQSIVTVSTLGTGFVFTVIFANIQAPDGTATDEVGRTVTYIRKCIMVAWLLFGMTAALATATATGTALCKGLIQERMESDIPLLCDIVWLSHTGGIAVLLMLPVSAFYPLALAVGKYDKRIKKALIVLLALTAFGSLFCWAVIQILAALHRRQRRSPNSRMMNPGDQTGNLSLEAPARTEAAGSGSQEADRGA
jgi:hypothetical protein